MKNAHRNILLAATAALALVVAPSAFAETRWSVNLPKPPSPRELLRHLPAPPFVQVDHRERGERYDDRDRGYDNRDRDNGRWNHQNNYRDDRTTSYRLDRYRRGHYRRPDLRVWVGSRWMMSPYAGGVWIDGRWLAPPFPGAVWVDGYYDEYGDWIEGGWVRPW